MNNLMQMNSIRNIHYQQQQKIEQQRVEEEEDFFEDTRATQNPNKNFLKKGLGKVK